MLDAQTLDRRGDQTGQRGGKCSDAQARTLGLGCGAELRVRKLQALRDHVGVPEQDLARGREPETAGSALEEPDAELAFEGGNLIGDHPLREGDLARGPRERAFLRHGSEGEHPSRVKYKCRL